METEFWAFIGKAFSVLAAAGVTAAGVAKWAAKQLAARFELKWKHQYDAKIEELRASLSSRLELLGSAVAAASSGHLAAQERRLEAVESMWRGVIDIRNKTAQIIMLYAVTLPHEYAA
ncbi:MAG: hypothetical protein ACREX4_19630, partial [Gammaproteobacteria bacterium]